MNYCYQNKVLTVWVLVFSLLLPFVANAKSPLAGTLIKNQASATYKDADGVKQMTTSNVVATLIQQVGAMELVQDQTRLGVAGNIVYLPHVLTNTGNGTDNYDLSVENRLGDDYDFDLSKVLIYEDKDKDGQPDSTIAITQTGALSADESFYFVIGAEIPALATDSQQGKIKVKGVSLFVETPTDLVVEKNNTDTVIVSDKAVITVVKSISANSGASPSGAYTVTLSYENKGLITADNVTLTDTLPAGMRYKTGAGHWSEITEILTDADGDAQGTAPNTVSYCAYATGCETQVSAVIAHIAAGASGRIRFEVNIDAGLAASTLVNIAEFSYYNGSNTVNPIKTNQVPFEVIQQPAVIANGSVTNPADGADNKGGTTSDSFIVDLANRGATVVFDNIIRNKGNGEDVFDISIDEINATFPAGTVFQLFQSDGFTPLMDSNNNGTVDTGILAVNASYKVVLKAVLPANASGDNAGTGFSVIKKATSSLDSAVFNTVIDHLGEITADSVDLTNNAPLATGDGGGIGPEATAVTVENVAPAAKAVFKLFVNNTSTAMNSYELQYSTKNPFEADFVEAGWQIAFYQDGGNNDCSTLGGNSNATNSIAAGASQLICAVVSVPANAIADGNEHPIYFKAYSRLTNAFDIKHDAVVVGKLPALSMAEDKTGQVEPGGSVIYPHRISNNGNTALECIHVTAIDADPQANWSSVIYKDVNGDGQLDAGDTPLVNQTLAAGESFSILIKLFAPATAPMGLKNTQTLMVIGRQEDGDNDPSTCTGSVLNDEVKDVTTVNGSKMTIIKEQALDSDCDGAIEGGFSTQTFQVQPGACVFYRLTATNTGATAVKNARIDDATPTFTQFFATATTSAGNILGGIAGSDGIIAAGSVNGASITLQSGEVLVLTFGVKLD